MIPRIIHYCWFGKNNKPDIFYKCLNSWKKYCPDFQIKEWNEDNYLLTTDFEKEAYKEKKWAFVSDVARLKILMEYGGIYVDTDVEFIKPIDAFLDYAAFAGVEKAGDCAQIATGLIMGAVKGHPWIIKQYKYYEGRHFIKEDGFLDTVACPYVTTRVTEEMYGVGIQDTSCVLEDDVHIFSSDYFCPKNYLTGETSLSEKTYTVHHYDASWVDARTRKYNEFQKKHKGIILKIYYLNYRYLKKGGWKLFIKRMKWKIKHSCIGKSLSSIKMKMIAKKEYIRSMWVYYIQHSGLFFRQIGLINNYKDIITIKNKHKGERLFIICSGPSLTNEDIEKLKNEKTFVMNTFVRALDDISYVPTYYAFQDGRVYERNRELIKKYVPKFSAVFAGRYFVKRKYYKDANWIKFPQFYLGGLDNIYKGDKTPAIRFSDDASLVVYDGGTIAYSILQIAVYMGFSEIYLIGADCEFSSGRKNDFTDKENTMTEKDLNRDSGGAVNSWINAYQKAKEYADEHEIRIYNATRGGKLEVFERVNLDEVLGLV